MEKKAWIMDIKHFAVHDGDGIRTTVFLKGCPLKCRWCHNPEGLTMHPILSYVSKNCISCGECVSACKNGAHILRDGIHELAREKCRGCGACAEMCLGDALRLYGREMSVDELMPELLEDRALYETSGGGVTLSGGECLLQWEFCTELLRRLQEEGIRTAVDTCGYVSRNAFDSVRPYADVFLYDIKAMDARIHREATGVSNDMILDNLRYLDEVGASVEVRIPYVPDYNASEMEAIGRFLSGIRHLIKVRLLPYHNLAVSKYQALGMENRMPVTLPTQEMLEQAQGILEAFGLPV